MPRLQKPECLLNAFVYRKWEFVRATRKYLGDMILEIYKNHDYAEKVATAASELIENAYKYSPEDSDMNITLERNEKEIVLYVRNYVLGNPQATLKYIKNEIELIWSDPDPTEAFKKKMMASLIDQSGKSMLGYAKIRLETGAVLNAELEDENLILITAVFPVDPNKASLLSKASSST